MNTQNTTAAPTKKKLNMSLLILAAAVIGIGLGLLTPIVSKYIPNANAHLTSMYKASSKIFILLIKMIVAPLVFSSLVVGICTSGGKRVSKVLGKAIVWFWLATSLALAVGLGAANIFHPGAGAQKIQGQAVELKTPKPFVEQVIPTSIVEAMAKNDVLQIVVFAVLFGMALAAVGDKGKPVVDVLKGITDGMFKLTEYVMYVVPLGVAGSLADTVANYGLKSLVSLIKLVGCLYLALMVFVVILVVVVKILTRAKILRVLREIKSSLLLAFSTASSETVLPKVIDSMEKLGVPPRIVRLVIPAGYSFNLDGTTLYLSLAALFIVQAMGISMSFGKQLTMMLTLLITSKGVAAVPRASLVVLMQTCTQFGLNVEWVATILAVDTFMDMARTSVNVLGNCLATLVVAKWEKELPADVSVATSDGYNRENDTTKQKPESHAFEQ